MTFVWNDGGRKSAGFKGTTKDCVVRAIAIATGVSYKKVRADLYELNCQAKPKYKTQDPTKAGTHFKTVKAYLKTLGWVWKPTMGIGTGCKVHLRESELPRGTIIVRVSKHLATVIDGVLQDISDCSRDGNRCVYGYFYKTGT